MKIGVIGGGAIGLLLSYKLCSDHQITVYVKREEQKQLLNEHGLHMDGVEKTYPVRSLLLTEIEGDEDCLFVCVKQPDLQPVMSIIYKKNITASMIFLQNGVGHIDIVNKWKNKSIVGVVEHGALRENDYTVIHTGVGKIKLAPFRAEHAFVAMLTDQFQQQEFIVQQEKDWKQLLYGKLIINAVINPLTTLFQVKNGEIITNHSIRQLAKVICQEVASILSLDHKREWIRVKNIAEQTRENYSSMLMDMNKKKKTEVEAILGYIIKEGQGKVPYTVFVYHAIKALEGKKGIVDLRVGQ